MKLINKIKKSPPLQIISIFIIWRLFLQLLAYISHNFINLDNLKPFLIHPKETAWYTNLPEWLNYFIKWDAAWYLNIAQSGYHLNPLPLYSNVVFFPLYPFLIKTIGLLTANYAIAGIIITHIALLLALLVLYRLSILETKNKKIALKTLIFLLIFPVSLFFTSVYTESLYLLLIITAFYAARTKNWHLAGIIALCASATRPTGILLLPALGIEYLEQANWKLKNIKPNILWFALYPLGLGIFMYFQWKTFGNPLLFSEHQKVWGRESFKILAPITTTISYIHDILIIETHKVQLFFTNTLNLLTFIFALFMGIVTYLKLRKSYGIFILLSTLIPSFTASLKSMSRFVLVLFPIFMVLAILSEKNKIIQYIYTSLALALLTIVTILFTQYYWIA